MITGSSGDQNKVLLNLGDAILEKVVTFIQKK
jgi:dsRNA-specific ribonuclease